ncbi:MAG: amidohydrolase family protein [Bacteroidia bacterium]|nr:amidohydrolase family protein [Bacteroidia bacterium]
MRKFFYFLFLSVLGLPLQGQNKSETAKKGEENAKWEVAATHGPARELRFTVKEGTWMNLDVSPDGKEIAFDLLGDIYTLPLAGGKARLISGGSPFEVQPRFSPDGKQILFTSDRAGGDNIWIMNRDGSGRKQLTKEDFRLLNNPVWTPDGQYFVARKHFTASRSLGAGEMWLYHITGGGGMQLTKRKNDQQDAGEPFVSPDGKYVYYSEDMSGGSTFEYNKDPNGMIYMIRRYDRQSGEIENITGGAGSAFRPTLSPDGKTLAFVRRVRTQTVLYLHDLATGEEWPVYDGLTKDQQETWAIFGVYPNFAWLPDNQHIVIYGKGKIMKVNTLNFTATEIPFEAEVTQMMEEPVLFRQEVSPETFTAKMIRQATTSPDGKLLAFNAAGYIYLKSLPDGKPYRLTDDSHFEFEPAFSPDGKSLVYTTWSDTATGAIFLKSVSQPEVKARKLTQEKGFYHSPFFSANGKQIVFRKGTGNTVLGTTYGKNPGVYTLSLEGITTPKFVCEGGEYPRYSSKGDYIYFQRGNQYLAFNLEKKEEQTLFSSQYANQFCPSPDGKWLAFTELFHAYIIPFPMVGKAVELSGNTKAIPVKKVTRDAGTSLHWSGDSKTLHWVLGPQYFSRSLSNSFDFVEGAPDSLPAIDTTGLEIGLQLKTDIPEGKIAFVNARIITMEADKVIEKGYILIEKNIITRVGEGERKFPDDVKVINCEGKTIIPGLIDVHAHPGVSYNGISPQQQWSYFANLAYGVTTTHDPSNDTEMVFSQSEMVKAGVMTGPRIYSTGTILYGADGDFKAVINSYEDALTHLRRLKAVGAFSVKSYNQPRRDQRQQVIKAARELKMMVYPEGGSTFYHNMSMILDGHTGIEHSIPVNPFYGDVTRLWAESKVGYTPTLIVGYGGRWGEDYWYEKTQVWAKSRLLNFTPRSVIDSRSRRRAILPDEEWDGGFIENSRGCKKLLDAGGRVQLGAHGQLEGLGVHWELWMFQLGGMTPLEALRAATQHGADYIGMGDQLGSVSKGKLADLVILDANPLENIRNTEQIHYVMLNGRLYDPETLNETGNYDRKRLPFYWENGRSSETFDWHGETHGFMAPKCGCVH